MLVWTHGKKIVRSQDKVKALLTGAINLLNLIDGKRSKNVKIDREIIKWWALLYHTRYLKNTSNSFVGISGDCFSNNLLNVTETLRNKT